MTDDFVKAVIEGGIKRPIELVMNAGHYPAALVLTYSGMDTMAFLNMAAERSDVMRSDFITWAERYIQLPGAGITARDLYGARCSVLHGGAPSRLSRGAECRPVHVSVPDLVSAFFRGVDLFLAEIEKVPSQAAVVARRLGYLAAAMPYSDPNFERGR